MDIRRLWRTLRLYISKDRNVYLRKAHIFVNFGEHSTMSARKIPLYPELIWIGNNVRLAANVTMVPHDMIHAMLNHRISQDKEEASHFREYIGCIRLEDNIFVGANSTILANVCIGSNTIIGAGTLVNKDLDGGYVYAGVPAKKICTFDEFVQKRSCQLCYPQCYKREGDSIGNEFAQWLWNDFFQSRNK